MITLEEELKLLRKGALSLKLPPVTRALIGKYQQREDIRTEAEAVRQIISAGLIAAEMYPD